MTVNCEQQENKTVIEWYRADDSPATSNRYLVYSFNRGYSYYAEYSSIKKQWTTGYGIEEEVDNHIDYWTFSPEPAPMSQTKV